MPDFYDFYINVVGLQNAKITGSQISSLCPIKEHSKKNGCFSANTDTGQCKCHKGCFSGNAYMLAECLNIDNPSQWLTNREHKPMEYKLVNTKDNSTEAKNDLLTVAKEMHDRWIQLFDGKNDYLLMKTAKEELVGYSKNNQLVFPYFNDDKSEITGIKYHKPKPYCTEGFKCTWYMGWYLKEYDADKPLYICEGEKDAIVLKQTGFQVISSSNGAGSLPDELDEIIKFECIFVYDNDEAGEKGALKNAMKINKISKDTIIKIAKWNSELPKGYDVTDDFDKTDKNASYIFDEFDIAIINAIEFKLTLPEKIGAFTIMTGSQATHKEAKPTEWLIENVLPKEFNSCLAGTTGSKKSMWAIQLSMALANGEKEFCGNKIIAPGIKVLYVDTEIGKVELHRRFKKIQQNMNWAGDENIVMMAKGGYHRDIWDDVHMAINYTNPELIVFDSLYNTTTVGDFSKSAQMSKVINELTRFKEQYGVTILAIAHFNKGQHDLGLSIDRMQGSAVLQNWVEFQSLMVSTNKSDFNLWTVAKARGVRHDQSIIGLKWNDFWFKTIGAVEDIKPFLIADEKKQKWQIVLEDCPEKFDTNQWLNVFSTKFPMSERTGRQWLKECSESPMVKKVAHGVYKKNLRLINEDNIDDE
jgi:KaiC/GvpD/RAD55 family RecA-like ATPase